MQKYGDDVHYVLTEEPYRMIAEIDGIGFKTADQIALAYGMDRQDPQRLSAGLTYVLRTMTQNGHVCIPDTELVRRAAFILQADALGLHDILREAIEVGQLCTADFEGTLYVYTPEAYEEEEYIAGRIGEMGNMKPLPMKTHVQLFLDRWQDARHFELADKQREAVEKSLQSGMTVITGGPGTGKTTVVQTIISLAEQWKACASCFVHRRDGRPSAWPKRRSARPRPSTACSFPTATSGPCRSLNTTKRRCCRPTWSSSMKYPCSTWK